jgi:hypothetical protein
MYVEFEPFEPTEPAEQLAEFEREVQQAFARRPAPPSLKRKLMEKRRRPQPQHSFVHWQRLAASLVMTAVLAGGFDWRIVEQRRKQEAARQEVLTALRITSHALNQMNSRLAAHRHGEQD